MLAIAGCGFEINAATPGTADAPGDAPSDADDARVDASPALPCASDPALRLCFSFDQAALPGTLPNEGTATVDAVLTDITRVAPSGSSGAAQLGPTSSIYVPTSPDVTGILALEVWFRADTLPTGQARVGLVDSNVIPPNISLFVYPQDPDHTLRCGIGSQLATWIAPLVPGAWHHATCVCDAGELAMYLDGTRLGGTAGECGTAGALVGDGFTIGSDNTGNPSAVGDRLAGAIDLVRIWARPLTAAEVGAAP